ncbi:hypothetical protein X975_20060, partial [Stegodyphus mimosarum]
MWILIATTLVIASAALGEDDICEKSRWEVCDSGIPFDFPSNEKEFDETCPIVVDESNCMLEHATKCEPDSLGDAAAIAEVLQVVCRKGSSLNEAIRPNVGCIKENVIKECSEKVRTVHTAYREYLNTTGEGFSDEDWGKSMCMSFAYDLVCAADAVSVPCGRTVKDAVLELANRIDWMEKKTLCPRGLREEIVKDIPTMEMSIAEKLFLEELLLDI